MVSRAIDSRSMIVFSPKAHPPHSACLNFEARYAARNELCCCGGFDVEEVFSSRTSFLLPYFPFDGRRPKKFKLESSEETKKKTKMKKAAADPPPPIWLIRKKLNGAALLGAVFAAGDPHAQEEHAVVGGVDHAALRVLVPLVAAVDDGVAGLHVGGEGSDGLTICKSEKLRSICRGESRICDWVLRIEVMAKSGGPEIDRTTVAKVVELKKELQKLLGTIADEDDVNLEKVDKAHQVLLALKELKLKKASDLKLHPQEEAPAPVSEEFKCPLSKDLMRDPVIISTGQTYERAFIQNWLKSGKRTCPRTEEVLSFTTLTPNHLIQDMITNWCKNHGIKLPELKYNDEQAWQQWRWRMKLQKVAVALVKELEEKGLKSNAYTYNLFIKTFVNEGDVEEGETRAEGNDGKKPEPIFVGENPAESSEEGKYSALSANQKTVDGQRGHYTESKAVELARIIVGVVHVCHSLGVMHRDLKLENFLSLISRRALKTIDFGLSAFFKPLMLRAPRLKKEKKMMMSLFVRS